LSSNDTFDIVIPNEPSHTFVSYTYHTILYITASGGHAYCSCMHVLFSTAEEVIPRIVAFMFLLWVLSERSERYFDLRGKLEYTYFAGDFGIYRFVDVCKME